MRPATAGIVLGRALSGWPRVLCSDSVGLMLQLHFRTARTCGRAPGTAPAAAGGPEPSFASNPQLSLREEIQGLRRAAPWLSLVSIANVENPVRCRRQKNWLQRVKPLMPKGLCDLTERAPDIARELQQLVGVPLPARDFGLIGTRNAVEEWLNLPHAVVG